MPGVKEGESRKSYVKRCISYVMSKEGIKDASHAAAKCHGIYDQHKKKAYKRYKKQQDKGPGE